MCLSHFQNESYVPQLFTGKFSPEEPKCVNGLVVRIGMASVFEKTTWKMALIGAILRYGQKVSQDE